MREILFRAKTVPSPSRGEESSIWVEGDLAVNYWNYCSIKERSKKGKRYIVIPSTIRQFTGLYDVFENRIFEGDIVDGIDGCDYPMSKGVVAFNQGCFYIYHTDEAESPSFLDSWNDSIIVVGNIYDNPEIFDEYQFDDSFFDADLYESVKGVKE